MLDIDTDGVTDDVIEIDGVEVIEIVGVIEILGVDDIEIEGVIEILGVLEIETDGVTDGVTEAAGV